MGENHGVEEILWTARWSPEGKIIAAGGNHDHLWLFSGEDYRLVQSVPVTNTLTQLAWHPGSDLLAVATQISPEGSFLYSIEKGKATWLDSLSADGARGIGWNFNGELLAVGDNDGKLTFFTRDGTFVRQVATRQKAITGLSWHPSHDLVATVGSQIILYDLERDSLKEITPRPEEVLMLSLAWHPSGTFFVTGDYGDYERHFPPLLQFWSPEGEKIREIALSKAEFRNLAWSPDGERLASASDALRIWSKAGELLAEGASKHLLWGVDWSEDGQKIVTSNEKGDLLIWDKTGKVLKQLDY